MKIKNKSQEQLHKIFLAKAKKESGCISCGRKIIDSFYRKSKSKEYVCICSLHVSPLSATPLAKTRIELDTCFKIINDVLISEEGVDAKWLVKKYAVTNETAWTILYKIKDWLNLVEEKNDYELTRFIKVEKNFRQKFVLRFKHEFSIKEMLNVLPPLFEHLREIKNAA